MDQATAIFIKDVAPHVAWPIAALLCAPIVIWKLGSLLKGITELREILKDGEGLARITSQVENMRNQVDELKKSAGQIRTDVGKSTEEIKQASEDLKNKVAELTMGVQKSTQMSEYLVEQTVTPTADISETTIAESAEQLQDAHLDAPTTPFIATKTPTEMHENVLAIWDDLKEKISSKCAEAKIKSDFRSPQRIGLSILELASQDQRKTRNLTAKDASVITAIASVAISAAKNGADISGDFYQNYVIASEKMARKIQGFKIVRKDDKLDQSL